MPAFMFTDIEGSTRKWQESPEAMERALAAHDRMLASKIEELEGSVVKTTGDGLMAVFENGRGLECALALQRAVLERDWSEVGGLRIRVGVDAGRASRRGGDYFGEAVNRTARLMSAGWGGQIVVGAGAAESQRLPEGARLEDRGVHMLRDLLNPQQVFTLSHPDLPASLPPLATVTASPHNLPVQPTPFVGRRRELREIERLVLDPDRRLLTLLGYGGAGKTRTALQAAANTVEHFRHGAWFVPLEESEGRGSMVAEMAGSLSVPVSRGVPVEDRLSSFLANRKTLLVLDNFDHLTDHAGLVSDLLAAAPGLCVIATSRARLRIREETVYDLSGMSFPEDASTPLEGCDATELFLASADRALPGFSPNAADRRAIAEICRTLEGLPLAIELAASWVRTIPCPDLAGEIGSSMGILEGTSADLPIRQRSMQSVFDYSWKLLDEDARRALAGLSVFEGGFTRAAAGEVAGCGLRTLQLLCDRSLVRPGQSGRFTLHPLTRELVSARIGLAPEAAARHSDHFHSFLDRLSTGGSAEDQRKALDAMEAEYPNLRAGSAHAYRSLDLERMDSYSKAIAYFLQVRSHFADGAEYFEEMLGLFEQAVADGSLPEEDRIRIAAGLRERIGSFYMMSGRRDEAAVILEEAAAMSQRAGDPSLETLCRAGLGNIAYVREDFDGAERNWRRAAELARQTGRPAQAGSLLANLASICRKRGQLDEASRLIAEALELVRTAEEPYAVASLLSTAGEIRLSSGDPEGACSRFEESLAFSRRLGNARGVSYCLDRLAGIEAESSPERALELARESLKQARESGSPNRVATSRLTLAGILTSLDRPAEALEQLDMAEEAARELGSSAKIQRITRMRGRLKDMDAQQ